MRTLLITALAACTLALPACTNHPSAITRDIAIVEPGLTGDWLTPEGDIVRIAGGWPASDYMLEVTTAEGNEAMPMRVATVRGSRVMEVLVTKPTGGKLPVYHYSKVTIAGNAITSQPINPEWLEAQAVDGTGVVGSRTESGKFVAAVSDPGRMMLLLERAATDPRAWLPSERLTRVNSR
ncbi:MAG: hypothetical protein AAFY58_07280 [Planctomycetota bacterium]